MSFFLPRAFGQVSPESVEVVEQENPYSMLSVKGKVVDITSDGADAHIDAMAKKYLGQDSYPFRQPGEERLIMRR